MFAFQTMPAKRQRDDESDSDLDDERHVKKSRPRYNHPFNPTPSFPPLSSTSFANNPPITPTPSEHGLAACASAPNAGGHALRSHSPGSGMDSDTAMEEYDSEAPSQLPESPLMDASQDLMHPARLRPSDTVNHTGRVSTPMHPAFKRGAIHRGHAINASFEATHENNGRLYPHGPSTQLPPAGNALAREADDEGGRRMPSPISEDEDIPDTPTEFTQSQLSRLSFSNANATDDMDTSSPSLGLAPAPRGRKRSGALTGVGRFTMGYRDDCEKCRQRIPGHYSHFLA